MQSSRKSSEHFLLFRGKFRRLKETREGGERGSILYLQQMSLRLIHQHRVETQTCLVWICLGWKRKKDLVLSDFFPLLWPLCHWPSLGQVPCAGLDTVGDSWPTWQSVLTSEIYWYHNMEFLIAILMSVVWLTHCIEGFVDRHCWSCTHKLWRNKWDLSVTEAPTNQGPCYPKSGSLQWRKT